MPNQTPTDRTRIHELRNLLNSIGSCAFLIRQRDQVEEIHELAARIRERAREAAEVLDELRTDTATGIGSPNVNTPRESPVADPSDGQAQPDDSDSEAGG